MKVGVVSIVISLLPSSFPCFILRDNQAQIPILKIQAEKIILSINKKQ